MAISTNPKSQDYNIAQLALEYGHCPGEFSETSIGAYGYFKEVKLV